MATIAENEVVREFCYQLAMALRRINGKSDENNMEDLPKIIGDRITEAGNDGGISEMTD